MIKNYLTIAVRTLLKNKVFSFINVLGLAIGISASLVIYLLVNYHFNFDKFEKDNQRIYRVVSTFSFSGEVYRNSGVMAPMGNAVRREFSGLEWVAPFYTWDNDIKVNIPSSGGSKPLEFKKEGNMVFADSGYFKMLGYDWIAGNRNIALIQPYQTVLTASVVDRYFPGLKPAEVIGKTITFNDTIITTVSGVVKDVKYNTDFTFKIFLSRATLLKQVMGMYQQAEDSWDNTNGASQLYVKLAPGTTTAAIEKQLVALFKKYHKPDPQDHSTTKHSLQPLNDVHFNAEFGGYSLPLANKPTLYSLLAIAIFLLVLGCINFVNLTTAHAAQRAKEIGIRKTLGSSRKQLVTQFLAETFLLTLAATIFSLALTPLLLKAFSGFIPDQLHVDLLAQPGIILFLVSLILVVTLLAGSYPALVLSGYKPVLVLKNQAYNNTGKTRNAWLRKTLSISQFTIAQIFIMGTILVGRQISYSINKDQGFKKDAILYMQANYYDTTKTNKLAFMEKLNAMPGISLVSLCSNPPSSGSTWSGTMKYIDGKKEIETDVQQKYGDTNYIKLYKLKLVAGSNLTESDTVNAFVINETYSRILGFQHPQHAVGKYLDWSNKKIPICGVLADFNHGSLHGPIKPLVLGSWRSVERNISVSLQPQNQAKDSWKTTIDKIGKVWSTVYPKDEFEFHFFDEDIAKYYTAEKNVSSLLIWATGLAVFISCLGLLGLVIYTTTQRTKEIGVRKVLGASLGQIVGMITKDFMLLIFVAFIIAVPLAYLAMHQWLQNFAFRTTLSWWIFAFGGIAMIIIALITLSIQTFRAAAANPVKSLRSE